MLRFKDLLVRAELLVAQLEAAGIPVKAGSRFDQYVAELRSALPHECGSPPEAILRRWHRLLIEVEDLADIVTTLSTPPATAGWKERVRESLSGNFLRTEEVNHSRARDIQFELILAAQLRKCGYATAFQEPDVIATIEDTRIGIAAKRPRSRQKLQKVAKEAARQVIKTDTQGIVAIDVTVVANPDDRHLATNNEAATQDLIEEQGRRIGRYLAATIGSRFGTSHIFAVLSRLTIPVWVPEERMLAFANQWTIATLIGANDSRWRICEELRDKMLACD